MLHRNYFKVFRWAVGLPFIVATAAPATNAATTNAPSAIPSNQIGAQAGANYQGDGLAVTPAGSGARLHCVFQRLDGEATPEGLWLTSTVTNAVSDRFRVKAAQVGRVTPCAPGAVNIQHRTSSLMTRGSSPFPARRFVSAARG